MNGAAKKRAMFFTAPPGRLRGRGALRRRRITSHDMKLGGRGPGDLGGDHGLFLDDEDLAQCGHDLLLYAEPHQRGFYLNPLLGSYGARTVPAVLTTDNRSDISITYVYFWKL